ncbi:hypothetical protein [Prevotella histicola]|jgi:hypothetical protein|uniref:hypothetical protein n=1 Tax=Prevotella histicola TaxID=470565 RepID=UPI00046FC7A4|nr:hypothetical protein [Prevotella histicola]MBF1396994.1 hypothetical protein [Prevotella histicola]MBF1399149.1 hypothetical protein [Prevotella histicola]MBF1403574.1 hypothetical protein [Prevotella histicola]MBF1416066.1 hypothetical protein [Prevotella histicola]MBF1424907.1 hypothetical protein [Prevotella histicola]
MGYTEQTQQQIERFLRKVAQKFTAKESDMPMTDIHLRASQDSGDLMAFDDDDNEISRCVISTWIENKSDNFYQEIAYTLRSELNRMKDTIDNLSIMKPFSFILEDDEKNNIAELYLVDDDLVMIGGNLMQGLDEDLDNFLQNILKQSE